VAADQMTADRPFSLVLAGVDGSERAVEAARQAARLASAAGAHLIVAYVIEDRPYEEGDAERALEAAGAVARTAGADPEARVLTGDDAGDALV
jgi:nucleotide-binding universal stress UspA family protein